jgi:hypothetical protein
LNSSNEIEEIPRRLKSEIAAVSQRDDTSILKNLITGRERHDYAEGSVENAHSQEGLVALHFWSNNVFAGL